jgi:hypothetical protein
MEAQPRGLGLAGGSHSSFASSKDSYRCCLLQININDRLSVALCSVEQGRDLLQWRMKSTHFILGAQKFASAQSADALEFLDFEPLGLKYIHAFSEQLWQCHEYKQGKNIVVCAGIHQEDITNTALLVGSFMILNMELSAEDVIEAFEPISHRFVCYTDQLRVTDCWSALYHAYTLCGWLKIDSKHFLSLRQDEITRELEAIDMAEFIHYDSPINGYLHVLIPQKLLVFNCPEDLPDGALWADEGGERRFSAAYYADVFGDFGVDVVVRGCADGAYDAAAFTERGIEVEELPLDEDAVPTLAEVDRFLAVVRFAPGAVAVHGGRGGLGAAGTLIAAHLISGHGFLAADAIAWVRLVHPAALPSAHQRFLRDNEARVLRRHRLLSHSFAGRPAASPSPGREVSSEVAALALEMPRSVSAPRIFDFIGGGGSKPCGGGVDGQGAAGQEPARG